MMLFNTPAQKHTIILQGATLEVLKTTINMFKWANINAISVSDICEDIYYTIYYSETNQKGIPKFAQHTKFKVSK